MPERCCAARTASSGEGVSKLNGLTPPAAGDFFGRGAAAVLPAAKIGRKIDCLVKNIYHPEKEMVLFLFLGLIRQESRG